MLPNIPQPHGKKLLNKFQSLAKSALLKDSVIYILGEMTAKAVPFLLLPYLTRMLGAEKFGALSYYTSISAFLLIFLSLSQSGALTRYFYVYGKQGLGNVLLAGGLYSGAVWLLASAVCLALGDELLLYACSTALLQTLVQNQLALRQCQKRPFSYFIIQISLAVTNVLLTLWLFSWFSADRLQERLLAVMLSFFLTFVGSMWLANREFSLVWRITPMRLWLSFRYILLLGMPLLLHGLSYTVKGQLDRVLIYQAFSPTELGVYSAGVQLASAVSIVIMAVNSACVPYLYERLKSEQLTLSHLQRLFWLSLLLSPILAGVVWLIPENWFAWLLGAKFAQSHTYTVLFVFAFALILPYLCLVNFLFYHGKNRQIATASVLSTLIYLAVLAWTSQIRLEYVPFATIISNFAILPLLYYFTLSVKQSAEKAPS